MCKEFLIKRFKHSALFLTLSFVILMLSITGCASVTACAADQPAITFVQEHAEPNAVLEVNVDGLDTDKHIVNWFVDNKPVTTGTSYIPTYDDLEKFISVVVSDENGDEIASKSIFCSKLPVIYIDTEGGVAVTSKEDYIDAEITVQGNSKYSSNNCDLYSGATEIKGRGNSTWLRFPKKPYRLKLDKKADLFGLGKNKHWALLANYIDDTMMRNSLAGDIAQQLDTMKMDSVSVDLVFNGKHVGNYLLIEHVRLDSKRVDVFDWVSYGEDVAAEIVKKNKLTDDDEDELAGYMEENLGWITSGEVTYKDVTYKINDYAEEPMPNANGGYLIEMDISMDEVSCFYTNIQTPMMIKDPEFVNTNSEMFTYIQNYINEFESAAYSPDHHTTINGKKVSYTDYADFDSMIRYWLTSEMLCNEVGFKSTYVHKDIDGKLEFGPIWDFDFSSGGVAPFGAQSSTAWITKTRRWFSDIMKDPYFAIKVRELFIENEEYFNNLVAEGGTLDQWYEYLYESGVKNTYLWHFSRGYEEDFKELKSWLTTRINWMSKEFSTDLTALSTFGVVAGGSDVSVSSDSILKNQDSTYYLSDKSDDKITVNIDNTSATGYNYYINSKFIGSGEIIDGKASFELDKAFLTEKAGTKNVIVIRTKDANGSFIGVQFVNVILTSKNTDFIKVKLIDGNNETVYNLPEGDKLYLDASKHSKEENLFSAWNDSKNNSYSSGKYYKFNKNTNLYATYEPCKNGSVNHSFIEDKNFDYICVDCNAEKKTDKKFIDVAGLTFNQTNRYSVPYTGDKVAPEIFVYNGDETLVEGTHYTLDIINNINIGYATYTITGLRSGGYDGKTQLCYNIVPVQLKSVIGGADSSKPYYYTGYPIKPEVNLFFGDYKLVEGIDYYISAISNNVNPGKKTAAITLTGMGNFTGSKSFTYTIARTPVSNPKIELVRTEYTYDGVAKTPKAIVTDDSGNSYREGTDYVLSYANNVNAGVATATVTFKNNYEGTASASFTIAPVSASDFNVSLSTTSLIAIGSEITPYVTVKDSSGKVVARSNYNVKYSNNINPGKATAKVEFIGNYTGTKTLYFNIILGKVSSLKATAGTTSLKLSWSSIPTATAYDIYFYSADKNKYISKKIVKTNSATISGLTAGKKYKIKVRAVYKDDTVGKFSGVLTTATKPNSTKITSIKSSKAKTVYLKWNEVANATGYQIWYSTSSGGKYTLLTTTKKSSITHKNSKLSSGKTYYFKIRAYKTISKGNNQFGAYTTASKVKIK